MNTGRAATIALVLYFAVAALMLISWVANIVKLIDMPLDPLTGMVIARVIGVFVPPVGIVLGVF